MRDRSVSGSGLLNLPSIGRTPTRHGEQERRARGRPPEAPVFAWRWEANQDRQTSAPSLLELLRPEAPLIPYYVEAMALQLVLKRVLTGPQGWIGRTAWSLDGTRTAAGSADKQVYVWNEKYENKLAPGGSKLAAEFDIISQRLMGTEEEKRTVLPLILEGTERESLPAPLRNRICGFFQESSGYFDGLLDLIVPMLRVPADGPLVAELKRALLGENGDGDPL